MPMNRFYRVIHALATPIVHLLFPFRAVGMENLPEGGVVVMATRTGTPLVPVYCGGKRKFLRRTSVVFGEPYVPEIAGRRPTQEENQAAAAEILRRAYALGEVDAWK